jgi:VWFA-related protein
MIRPASAALSLFALASLAGQQAASDEVRVRSQPYVPQSTVTFHVESKLVDVGVTVRDSRGRAVSGLKRENFRIFDDGKEREIASFFESHASSDAPTPAAPASAAAPVTTVAEAPAAAVPVAARPPRLLAIFFDDVNVNNAEAMADLKRAQAASTRWLKEHLQPGVRAGVFTVSRATTLDFTSDPAKLEEAVAEVKPHPRFTDRACPRMNPYEAYRIAQNRDSETIRLVLINSAQHKCGVNRESVVAQAEEVWRQTKAISVETLASLDHVVSHLASIQGERVLLLASSGFAAQTLEAEQDRIIGQAVRAGVTINSLVTQGLYNGLMPGERFDDPAPGKAIYTMTPGYQRWAKAEDAEVAERPQVMDEALSNLARGTGGLLFEKNNDLNLGFRQLSVPPEVTYRMSFNPQGVVEDGSYHLLKVKLARSGSYSLASRPGYFAQEAIAVDKLRAKIESEVAGSEALAGLPAQVSLQVAKPSETERVVRVLVHVDLAKLPFAKSNDRQIERLTFVAAFFDPQGKMVSAKEGAMDLALKPDTYEKMARTGVNAELTFQIVPGTYRMRAVVGEAAGAAVAASTYPIDVR